MAQKVIASRDVDIHITFDALQVPVKLETGSSVSINIAGSTEDIAAISSGEPIAIDNGMTSYDIALSLQEAEALAIKDALAAATVATGSISHIRQIVEGASISITWNKRRDIPATATIESYSNCSGVSEADNIERSSSETIKNWNFRARGMSRRSTPIGLTATDNTVQAG